MSMKEDFGIAVAGLAHPHIFGMTKGLLEAGAVLRWVWDEDLRKAEEFRKAYGDEKTRLAEGEEAFLEDPAVRLVVSAAIPVRRAGIGIRAMKAGKDYFVDKAPFISLEQLEKVKQAIKETGRKYMVYYSERLQSEAAGFADELIRKGTIGRVIQVLGMGPHRLGQSPRPDWFFDKAQYGGILCDIGSHQIEQFLYYTGARDAVIASSHIANYSHPEHPDLDDYGDVTLEGDNGAMGYFRVDWFTPDGLSNWGDGRTFLLGTEGYIELRKYVDIARGGTGLSEDHVYWADKAGEHYENVHGKIGYPFFARLISDCRNRTETALGQEHALKAGELSVRAQMAAVKMGINRICE